MHSIALTGSLTSDDLWALSQALRDLGDARAALDGAAAALQGLTADTAWQSDGVRALHSMLDGLRVGALHQEATVDFEESQIRSLT